MHLNVPWHIPELCNWRCNHCSHDCYTEYWPSLEKLKEVFNDVISLKTSYYWKIDFITINFVWWEPFVRKDFLDLLEYINSKVNFLQVWILTNWSLLTDDIMKRLVSFKNLNIFFQFSIEWTEKINDEIRWIWSFNKVVKAIEISNKYNIRPELSLTLTNQNKDELVKLFPFVKKYDIKLKARRFIPMGQWKEDMDLLLPPKEFYLLTKKVKLLWHSYFKDLLYWWIGFKWCSEMIAYDYEWFWCWVNDHRILIILENLDVMACRKLDVVLWSLKDKSLEELYFWDKYIDMIKSPDRIDICKSCDEFERCKWWAKCVSYSINWSYDTMDPQCYKWQLLTKKLWKKKEEK